MRRLPALAVLSCAVALCCCAAAPAAAKTPTAAPLATAAASSDFSLTPADYRAAYSLPKIGASHQTIAIVSAYGDPSIQADLDAYSKRFGIPPCTKANHCFRELNQNGATSPLPMKDSSGVFLTESSVGTEVARGVCQSCSIMLVEATSASKSDVSTAVRTAARAGATVVVTTFQEGEASGDSLAYGSDYLLPHTVVVAASGDSGYDGLVFFPASLPSVIAVGGTQLDLTAAGRYQSETAWPSTVSGCSMYNPAEPWQAALAKSVGCGGKRAVADIAAAAAPGALVHIQDVGTPCGSVFCEADGTSVSAPIIAGIIGLAGGLGSAEARILYQHAHTDPGAFHDVRTGSSAASCNKRPICQARRGYDGPTGLGTPYGLAAFLRSGGALDRHHPELTITGTNGRLRASARWITRLGLQNQNPFSLTGTVALWSGRRMLASTRVMLGPLVSTSVSVTVASRYRTLLASLGTTRVRVVATIRGPAGDRVNVTKSLRLSAP